MRPVISYDDITLPYEMTSNTTQEAITPTVVRHDKTPVAKPSSKKRKRKSRHSSSGGNTVPQVNGYDDEDAEYLEVEESRELTHSEIWDDSALIDAWNAAAEEYKAYHGPDKGWKNEPVHKSPLWYNTPPPPSKKQKISQPSHLTVAAGPSVEESLLNGSNTRTETTPESDSKPIDFNTFVPTHDAGLSVPPIGGASGSDFSAQPGQTVSQDEAFKRALEATYWSGYWTAVYHMRGGSELKLAEEKKDIALNVENDELQAAAEAQMKEDKAILDIGDDGEFEGDEGDDLLDEEDEYGNEDDIASSPGVDFVSTQR